MLEQQLTEYICQNFGVDESDFDKNTDLVESGILDSFGMVDIISFIEGQENIKFNALDLTISNLESIEAMMRFVERKKDR